MIETELTPQQRDLDRVTARNAEMKEGVMLTLAMVYFNRYRTLLNFELAQMLAQDAQDFYDGKLTL